MKKRQGGGRVPSSELAFFGSNRATRALTIPCEDLLGVLGFVVFTRALRKTEASLNF